MGRSRIHLPRYSPMHACFTPCYYYTMYVPTMYSFAPPPGGNARLRQRVCSTHPRAPEPSIRRCFLLRGLPLSLAFPRQPRTPPSCACPNNAGFGPRWMRCALAGLLSGARQGGEGGRGGLEMGRCGGGRGVWVCVVQRTVGFTCVHMYLVHCHLFPCR